MSTGCEDRDAPTWAVELALTDGAIVVILRLIMCPTVLLNFGERGAGP